MQFTNQKRFVPQKNKLLLYKEETAVVGEALAIEGRFEFELHANGVRV